MKPASKINIGKMTVKGKGVKATIRKGIVKFLGDTPAGKKFQNGLKKQNLDY